MVEVMSNRQILLIAIALGFIGGFSLVATGSPIGNTAAVAFAQ